MFEWMFEVHIISASEGLVAYACYSEHEFNDALIGCLEAVKSAKDDECVRFTALEVYEDGHEVRCGVFDDNGYSSNDNPMKLALELLGVAL